MNKVSLRVSSLENELAAVNHGISALVGQANRYTNSQRQYADYLKKVDEYVVCDKMPAFYMPHSLQ